MSVRRLGRPAPLRIPISAARRVTPRAVAPKMPTPARITAVMAKTMITVARWRTSDAARDCKEDMVCAPVTTMAGSAVAVASSTIVRGGRQNAIPVRVQAFLTAPVQIRRPVIHQPARIRVRPTPQQRSIHRREGRRRAADAQTQRQNRRRREPRRPQQRAQPVTHILQHRLHHTRSPSRDHHRPRSARAAALEGGTRSSAQQARLAEPGRRLHEHRAP